MRRVPRIRASGLAGLLTLLAVTISVAMVVSVLILRSQSLLETQATETLSTAARGAADQLVRTLNVQWHELQVLGQFAGREEPVDVLRLHLETIKAANDRYTWLGVVNPSGRVAVATDGLREGQSVAERTWFKSGLESSFAGDLHETLFLKNALSAQGAESSRLIDFATPIRNQNGDVIGVIGAQIKWTWLADLIRGVGKDNGVDLALVARDGTVLVGPPDLEGQRLQTQSAFSARQGVATTRFETWDDRADYLVSVVPMLEYRNLPSFGWSLIARKRADLAFMPLRSMTTSLAPALLGSVVTAVIAALLLGRMLGRPFARMAAAAANTAIGKFDQPITEERTFREAAELSASLSRLQSMILAAQDSVAKQAILVKPEQKLVQSVS